MNRTSILMLLALTKLLPKDSFVFGEDPPVEDEIDPEVDPATGKPKVAPVVKPVVKPGVKKTYSEEEFNAHTKRLRTTLEAKLEAAASNAKSTTEERDAARIELETLQAEYKSKEQLSQEALTTAQKKHAKDLKAERDAKEKAEKDYAELLIDNELTREEAPVGPSIAGALVDAMRSKTKLVDEVNSEGKTTGKKVVRLEFDDLDKDGKPIKSLYPVKDAFKRMKEIPEKYGIYFKGVGTGGIGGNNGRGSDGKALPPGELPKDTDTYMEKRNAAKKAAKA